jgi:hypothetical protein
VDSGSEKKITEEKDWMSKHSSWEEDDATSSYVPPQGDEDAKSDEGDEEGEELF